jgi:hypothetical protein
MFWIAVSLIALAGIMCIAAGLLIMKVRGFTGEEGEE